MLEGLWLSDAASNSNYVRLWLCLDYFIYYLIFFSMIVLHRCFSDGIGGAARAAYRIHGALLRCNVSSWMNVERKYSDDWTVFSPHNFIDKAMSRVRPFLSLEIVRVLKTKNSILHSPAIFPSLFSSRRCAVSPDIIHLHWVCGEALSVKEIGQLRGPIVWTLHDMWAFCGAEHCTEDFRWREGYMCNNRPPYESGIDLNRWVWCRKRKFWKRRFHIVAPSRWLGQCVQESALMRDWPVTVIPNLLNTDVWRPVDRSVARRLLGMDLDVPTVLFGAIGGEYDPNKGFDLLRSAIMHLREQRRDLHLVIFGQSQPKIPENLGFPVQYLGHLHDNLSLRIVYSAADVMVVPSRQEAFGQTASESQACGTPVVAFDTCGLPDIVSHQATGYLARPFDTEDLAAGIEWVLADSSRHDDLSRNARTQAVERFSEAVVVPQYLAVYQKAIEEQSGF